MSTLKRSTRTMLRIAKERRKGLKEYAKFSGPTITPSLSLPEVRKSQANSIKANRFRYGVKGNRAMILRGHGRKHNKADLPSHLK